MVTRSCLICGEMICGCAECRGQNSPRSRYGLCKSCAVDLTRLSGGKTVPKSDESAVTYTKHSNRDNYWRVRAKLEEWSHA